MHLLCEDGLVCFCAVDPDDIEALLLRPSTVARGVANAMLDEPAWLSGDLVVPMLNQKMPTLSQIDPDMRIEVAFFTCMVGPLGQSILERKAFASFPTTDDQWTVTQSLALLQVVKASQLHAFCRREAQSHISIASDLLVAMQNARQPWINMCMRNVLLKSYAERLNTSCFVVPSASASTADLLAAKVLYGAAAIAAKFEATKLAVDSGGAYGLQGLDYVHVYSWLVTEAQNKEVSLWIAALFAALEAGAIPAGDDTLAPCKTVAA